MPRSHFVRESNIIRTPRVMQLEGIFDIAPSERSSEQWDIDFDLPDEWNIGLIVGPSGSGKTSLINELWPNNIVSRWEWDDKKSLLDDFPKDMSIKEIVELLNSVGFSTPPSWVRPFRVLSNGEQFRVHIARTLAENKELSVIDEFTSVVDRTVAQIGSAAIQKTIRKRNQKMIAVSCHYDIIDWLEPDWIYEPHTRQFHSGRWLHQRPKIEFTVRRVHSSAWEYFKRFHYLDVDLNTSARCFVASIKEIPVAFCAVLSFPHPNSPGWRISRLVVLPDYQGIGIGIRFSEFIGSIYKTTNKPIRISMAQPALIRSMNKSKTWKMIRSPSRTSRGFTTTTTTTFWDHAYKRFTASFEYIGAAMEHDLAYKMLGKG